MKNILNFTKKQKIKTKIIINLNCQKFSLLINNFLKSNRKINKNYSKIKVFLKCY